MFGFWPQPLEDELLYSLLARTRLILGVTSSEHLLRIAFGHSRQPMVDAALPTSLDFFSDRFPGGFPGGPDAIIDRHTALPYLARFMSREAYDGLRHTMKTDRRQRSLTRRLLGDASALWRDGLLFCPSCVIKDIDTHGLPGYRRAHQMPGVLVCPWHGTALRTVRASKGHNFELFPCPLHPEAGVEIHNPLDTSVATWLSKGSLWLLSEEGVHSRIDRVRQVMSVLLASRGWVDSKGKITREFKREYWERFGRRGTTVIDPIRGTGGSVFNTVFGLPDKRRSVPLCFLIMLMMLEMTPEDFFRLC